MDISWIGARNEIWGSTKFLWMSDDSVVDSALLSGAIDNSGGYSGLHGWTGGVDKQRINDYPSNAALYAVCEVIGKGMLLQSDNFSFSYNSLGQIESPSISFSKGFPSTRVF